MSTENQLAVHAPVKASDQLASFLGIDKGMMLETLKAQCFKGKRPDEVSDTQLAAFVSTANVLQVNPLVPGMLYAYPERNGGITPILGPDGVFKKLDEFIASGKLSGFDCEVFMGTDGKPDRAEAVIYRAEGQKPAKYTAYFSEWSVTSNPNWQARPRHMLWTRAIKQAARQVIHGLPMDADEYEIAQMHNVTNTASEEASAPARPKPPARSPKGAAAVMENAAPKPTVIEAEVVAPATTPEPAAKPVVQTPAPAPKPVEPTPEPKTVTPEPASEAAPAQPRAFLKDGEIIVTQCEVAQVDPMIITATVDGVKGPRPSVQVKLKGGFEGVAYHIGGGIKDGEAVKPGAGWVVGASVNVKLRGKMNSNPKVNKVQVFVDDVEALQETMEA
jgi:hypothetical protein